MQKNPRKYLQDIVDKALKFNRLFSISAVLAALWFSYQSKIKTEENASLVVTNAYLLAQNRSSSKAINETPLAWWKKEVFPESAKIIMMDYNDAFYNYMMKPIGMGRYDYIRKQDEDFFPYDVAKTFYREDFGVYVKFMDQEPNSDGTRPMYIEEFENHWVDLLGDLNKDGYWRFAAEESGHYFVYGMLKKPKPNKKKTTAYNRQPFIKPRIIQIVKKKST